MEKFWRKSKFWSEVSGRFLGGQPLKFFPPPLIKPFSCALVGFWSFWKVVRKKFEYFILPRQVSLESNHEENRHSCPNCRYYGGTDLKGFFFKKWYRFRSFTSRPSDFEVLIGHRFCFYICEHRGPRTVTRRLSLWPRKTLLKLWKLFSPFRSVALLTWPKLLQVDPGREFMGGVTNEMENISPGRVEIHRYQERILCL